MKGFDGLWGLVAGYRDDFMACWDTGDNVFDPFDKNNGLPLRKKLFWYPGMGCRWRKEAV